MRNFIAFQKRKGLFLTPGNSTGTNLAHQFNHELMKYGYVVSRDLFDRLETLSKTELQVVYEDVLGGIRSVTGGGGYEPIYRNFPQSVLEMSYTEFAINAITHYWSFGTWRPEDEGYLNREFAVESVDYKTIRLLEPAEFNSIFTDIIYSTNSISAFDKDVVNWFIDNGATFDFGKIKFKEIAAFVGKRLLDSNEVEVLPTNDATNVLRIWSAYSGGDEGLKENTRFANPSNRQKRVLLATLDSAYNLEESFKSHREKWLRLLHPLHPQTASNRKRYPVAAAFAQSLRNEPKELRTFNSRLEELITNEDIAVLDILKTRLGVYTRRLDHMVRLFGVKAFTVWLNQKPNALNLINAYNHFTNRDQKQEGRGVVLASQSQSEVTTFGALEPLPTKLVTFIKDEILATLKDIKQSNIGTKSIFIDPSLYYKPMASNNRASSMTLSNVGNGTVELLPDARTIRLYVHWEGRSDIDLSALVITDENVVTKIGWNSLHHTNESIIYSGDNTGHSAKNAEYIDVDTSTIPNNVEWIITEARIYRGPANFAAYNGTVHAGWMTREEPYANDHWLPETISHATRLDTKSKTAYLLAIHVPTRQLVYLDVSMGSSRVSGAADALKMRIYLDKFITYDENSVGDIDWSRLNQGHILNLLSEYVVSDESEADVVFNEDTTSEEVVKYL